MLQCHLNQVPCLILIILIIIVIVIIIVVVVVVVVIKIIIIIETNVCIYYAHAATNHRAALAHCAVLRQHSRN